MANPPPLTTPLFQYIRPHHQSQPRGAGLQGVDDQEVGGQAVRQVGESWYAQLRLSFL